MTPETERAGSRQPRTGGVRAALIETASTVLERDGLGALTIRTVAAEAGVAPMGVYNHLQNKDGLLLAVLAAAFDRLAEQTRWRADLPPASALRELGRSYRRFALAQPVTYGLMFGAHTRLADERAQEEMGTNADGAFHTLLGAVRAAQQADLVRVADPEPLALAIWSTLHGAVDLEISGTLPPNHDADAGFEAVLDLIQAGLTPTT